MSTSAPLNELRPPRDFSRAQIGGAAWLKAGRNDESRAKFEPRRHSVARCASRKPIERVAAFLVAISRNNSYEGRHPNAIPDCLKSGFVAELLGLSVDLLADLLLKLASQGLVQPDKVSGLLITDPAALERLADAH
jgi:CRP/FNR family transcriptional regulator, anaerobic regulatory protein